MYPRDQPAIDTFALERVPRLEKVVKTQKLDESAWQIRKRPAIRYARGSRGIRASFLLTDSCVPIRKSPRSSSFRFRTDHFLPRCTPIFRTGCHGLHRSNNPPRVVKRNARFSNRSFPRTFQTAFTIAGVSKASQSHGTEVFFFFGRGGGGRRDWKM